MSLRRSLSSGNFPSNPLDRVTLAFRFVRVCGDSFETKFTCGIDESGMGCRRFPKAPQSSSQLLSTNWHITIIIVITTINLIVRSAKPSGNDIHKSRCHCHQLYKQFNEDQLLTVEWYASTAQTRIAAVTTTEQRCRSLSLSLSLPPPLLLQLLQNLYKCFLLVERFESSGVTTHIRSHQECEYVFQEWSDRNGVVY